MKILHLASFSGNIGDNANHAGFRPWLESLIDHDVTWTNLEIREYYWRERKFDDSFVELTSHFDLLVLGGGNYFELWVDDSPTGTSFNIPLEVFKKIKTPIFFNALGCDEGQGVTKNSITNFKNFLEALSSSQQYLVTLRNDGAMKTLRKHVPLDLAEKVYVIPDGGFFINYPISSSSHLSASNKRIGINLASDMVEVRFKNFGKDNGYSSFCDEFASFLEKLAREDPEISFLFFPHIFRDLEIISDIISRLNDRLRRTRVATAPYLTGDAGAQYIFGLYQVCQLILGMRFHSNVCAIGMGIPTLGLCNYPQIDYLYEEINFPEGAVSVRDPKFSIYLEKVTLATLNNEKLAKSRNGALVNVRNLRKRFEGPLVSWLHHNDLL